GRCTASKDACSWVRIYSRKTGEQRARSNKSCNVPITSDMHMDRGNLRARQVMQMTRRGLIQLAISCFSIAHPTQLFAQSTSDLPLPPEENFESGDFLWPKRPGAYVPYS